MTGAVAWRPAEKTDRRELAVFVCADPAKPARATAATGWKALHPRVWEYDAQQIIRSCRPPLARGRSLWVGVDPAGLAAALVWTEVDGPGFVHLDVFGVATRHRRSGGAVAREGMRLVLGEIKRRAYAAGCAELVVEGEIYAENQPSLQLMADFEFEFIAEHPTGAQTWGVRSVL